MSQLMKVSSLAKRMKKRVRAARRMIDKQRAKHLEKTGAGKELIDRQSSAYEKLGFDRQRGLEKLNRICVEELGTEYDEHAGTLSEHLVLMSSISVARPDTARILEIGTFNGRSSFLISKMFPGSRVTTMDLPSTSAAFQPKRSKADREKFLNTRASWLQRGENIELREMSSVCLLDSSEEYDLIWVDGAHAYPIVAIDITNSYRLAKPGGLVLMDDVRANVEAGDDWFRGDDTLETLTALKSSSLISDFHLVLKRVGVEFNLETVKEYVAVFQKEA